ncbi:hypothetical protein SAMN04244548_04928 [Paracoccus pantotrophus]|nr:hypothetical protein SAMN04244548_04928 [Paracoccus pantotrophus]
MAHQQENLMKLTPDQRAWISKVVAAIFAVETGPSALDLANAPVLDCWRPLISHRGDLILFGMVSGHPKLGDNQITTSQLIAINTAQGWARTVSRWYRLARSFAEYEAEVARTLDVKAIQPGFLKVHIAGFEPLEDPVLLTKLIDAYVGRIKEIDAENRNAGKSEDDT